MSTLAIEINDSGILVARDGRWRDVGPGYALLDPGEPLLGEDARAQARLRPRGLENRFWQDLSVRPLSRAMPYAANHADLACAQLRSIWTAESDDSVQSVIFLVPGFFSNETLGLLLGIAQDCGVPARGVVDTAVAASPELVNGRSLLHMDIHLHATVLTELVAAGGVARGKVQVLEAVGLASLEQNWMATTAEAFVRQTRFDPLHDAGTEQVLADGLPQWLSALVDQVETGIELQRGERTLTASLTRRQLIEVAAPLYERLVRMVDTARLTSGPVTLNLSHRLGRLPGLADRLREIDDVEVEILPEGRAVLGALERSGDILSQGENVRFTTMLPLHQAGELPVDNLPPPPMADTRPRPTHLLAGSVVYRISAEQITIGAAPPADQRPVVVSGGVEGVSRRHCSIFRRDEDIVVADHSRYGTFLNDRKVQGEAVLAVGDVIRVGSPGSSFVLVEARD